MAIALPLDCICIYSICTIHISRGMFEVLFILWSNPPAELQFHLVELFAGECQVSSAWRECGRNVCSFDIRIGGDSMDMCRPSGFAFAPKICYMPASAHELFV